MTFRNYFLNTFPKHLQLLKRHQPNEVVRECIMKDNGVMFFGGRDWNSVADDLSQIPHNDRPKFILSLFMEVMMDQCLYTYQPNVYPGWRMKTNLPKFGWSGLGPHHENPLKILWAPERERIVTEDDVINILHEFIVFMLEETNQFFADNAITVNTLDFLQYFINDNSYAFSEGNIVQRFKREFQRQIFNRD